jgi:hypothetical protein
MLFLMKKHILLLLITVISLTSCTTSRSVISDSANLDKYKYASLTDVMNYNGSAALMDIEVKVYDALESTRLKMIGDRRIGELSPLQKEQLLLVRFSASQNDEESVVSVNFVDYMTGKPVASCRGAFGLGWDRNGDMKGAINRVVEQIKKLF